MFTKKRFMLAGLTVLALSAAALLKDFQKEKRVLETVGQNSITRGVDSGSPDFKPAFPTRRDKDAGIDVALLITKMLELAQELERLELLVSKNIKSIENDISDEIKISSVEDAKRIIAKKVESEKEDLDLIERKFENYVRLNKDSIELAKTGHSELPDTLKYIANFVAVRVRSLMRFKAELVEIRETLVRQQNEVNKLMLEVAGLGDHLSIRNISDRLNKLNDDLSKVIDIYDYWIDSLSSILGLWEEVLNEVDIDGSQRRNIERIKKVGEDPGF